MRAGVAGAGVLAVLGLVREGLAICGWRNDGDATAVCVDEPRGGTRLTLAVPIT